MKVSLSGILAKSRIKCRRDIRYMLDCFLEHYDQAKKANASGDTKTVAEFFELYVND